TSCQPLPTSQVGSLTPRKGTTDRAAFSASPALWFHTRSSVRRYSAAKTAAAQQVSTMYGPPQIGLTTEPGESGDAASCRSASSDTIRPHNVTPGVEPLLLSLAIPSRSVLPG